MEPTTVRHWTAVRFERPRARQPWRCHACGLLIHVGQPYRKISGLRDGEWQCLRTCERCSAEAAA
jgi:hypothetical protein